MKQTDKVVIKHKKLNNDDLFDAVKRADEDDLRVLLAAILLEDGEGEVKSEDICRAIDIDEATFGASLKFWRGASVMSAKRSISKAQPEKSEKPKSAHKDGKLENDSAIFGFAVHVRSPLNCHSIIQDIFYYIFGNL